MTATAIATLTARLQASRKGTLLNRLRASNRPRPCFVHLNDPGLWARLTDTVEGHDDDAVPAPVKAVVSEPPLPPGVLSVEQGARYLGVTPDQLKGLIADGEVHYINLGRGKKRPRIGVTIPDLDETIKNRRQRAVPPCPSSKSKGRRSSSTSSSGTVVGFAALRDARANAKPKR